MPIIPMRQTVKVYKAVDLDGYGKPVYDDEPVIFKCRVDEGSELTGGIRSRETGRVEVPKVRIMLDGLPDIDYADEIHYTNELGNTIKQKPLRISVKRDISGKPILTEVLL